MTHLISEKRTVSASRACSSKPCDGAKLEALGMGVTDMGVPPTLGVPAPPSSDDGEPPRSKLKS